MREFQTASGSVDYGLFVGEKLGGVIEAKPEGTTLPGYSEEAARYVADVPRHLVCEEGQDRFEYVASGTETLFRDHTDPDPASRRVALTAGHGPEDRAPPRSGGYQHHGFDRCSEWLESNLVGNDA